MYAPCKICQPTFVFGTSGLLGGYHYFSGWKSEKFTHHKLRIRTPPLRENNEEQQLLYEQFLGWKSPFVHRKVRSELLNTDGIGKIL